MATTIIVGKACKQATSAYRRELGLAWLVVPAHSVSPARSEEFMGRQAGRTGTVEEVPRPAAAPTFHLFIQL